MPVGFERQSVFGHSPPRTKGRGGPTTRRLKPTPFESRRALFGLSPRLQPRAVGYGPLHSESVLIPGTQNAVASLRLRFGVPWDLLADLAVLDGAATILGERPRFD